MEGEVFERQQEIPLFEGDEEHSPDHGSDLEQDEPEDEEVAGPPYMGKPWQKGEKVPLSQYPYCAQEAPDLREYFEQFDLRPEEEVSICRAYASYLTSLGRAGKKAPVYGKKPGPKAAPYKGGSYYKSGGSVNAKRSRFSE